jgi:hypothetical protein
MFLARQGDVLVLSANRDAKPAASVPRDRDRVVLAYGEVTGHAHAILDREAELYTIPYSADRFLRIMAASGAALVHEEHDPITIPAGDYIVRIQREYTSADMPSLRVSD